MQCILFTPLCGFSSKQASLSLAFSPASASLLGLTSGPHWLLVKFLCSDQPFVYVVFWFYDSQSKCDLYAATRNQDLISSFKLSFKIFIQSYFFSFVGIWHSCCKRLWRRESKSMGHRADNTSKGNRSFVSHLACVSFVKSFCREFFKLFICNKSFTPS